MCGLCGFISNQETNIDDLIRMTDSIAHRGPDGSGYHFEHKTDLYVGLGHRRLSIIDLDKRSGQPFFNQSRDIALIYNGEIYNYEELKLSIPQYRFRTTSDTEVIMAMYEIFGIEFVDKLIGIFAFVIFDYKLNKTFLVRDRHGVKPLYYFVTDNNLVFSSELRPIMEYPHFDKEIDLFSLELMLSLKYIPSPKSIFTNVKKLMPGTIMIFEGTKKVDEIIYWDSVDVFNNEIKSNPDMESYKKIIDESVKRNLVGDVEIATFLSGGVDSSLVTAVAKKLEKDIKSFTIGFDSMEYDESELAKLISKSLEIDNITKILVLEDLVEVALNIGKIYDEPFSDSSQLPTFIVSKLVKDNNIKVVLSGDGGDEFFFGYNNYTKIEKRFRIFKFANLFTRGFSRVLSGLTNNLFFYVMYLLSDIKLFYYGMNSGYSGYYSRSVIKKKNNLYDIYPIFGFLDKIENYHPIIINSLFDQKIYMIDDILVKVDRASMANSIESRVPLLDHPVSIASYRSNINSHINNSNKKIILKNYLAEFTSKEFVERQKKGFTIPLFDLLKNQKIRDKMIYYSSKEYLEKQNIFKTGSINKLVTKLYKNSDRKVVDFLWNFFVFQSWYEEYMVK